MTGGRIRALWLRVLHGSAKRATLVLATAVGAIVRRSATRRRRRGEKPRILRAPVPLISIHYAARAERLHGYASDTLVYRTYRIHASDLFDHDLSRWIAVPLVGQLVPYAAFLWAVARYDVFVFFFDGGLLGETPSWRLELPLLRRAGKKVVAYPYGADVRLPSRVRAIEGWHAYSEIPPGQEDRSEADVAARLAVFGEWADVILGCADHVEDLPRLDGLFHLPIDQAEWRPAPVPPGPVVRVVHAPNHPQYKGTAHVVAAVEKLRAEGAPVELVLVQGTSGDEARALYEQSHIVIDQLLIGAYGQFAIEGMALGRPVVCYLNPRFAAHHPEWTDVPIVSATPDTILAELRRLVADRALRERLGARGPEFVRRYHSLDVVGARMGRLYDRLWEAP